MSLFVGELFHLQFLSKNIFKDCFYELLRGYIIQYYKYRDNKGVVHYESYIQCILIIIEKMSSNYDKLMRSKNVDDLDVVISEMLESTAVEDANFEYVCDYLEILRRINERLPSSRFKIKFLLEDFRCVKILKKEKDNVDNK